MLSRKFFLYFLISLVMTTGVIIFSYFFCDRPIAEWVYHHHIAKWTFLKGFSYIATGIKTLAGFILCYCGIKRFWKPWNGYDLLLLRTSLSILIAEGIDEAFKGLFGRFWPTTWVNGNLSLISNGSYGFNFFHLGTSYQSFPSGHMSIVLGGLTMITIKFPKSFLICLALALLQMIGLIGMNYHFLSDTIGGAYIGILTALFMVHLQKNAQ